MRLVRENAELKDRLSEREASEAADTALAFDCFCKDYGCGLFGGDPGSGIITFEGCSGNEFNARYWMCHEWALSVS